MLHSPATAHLRALIDQFATVPPIGPNGREGRRDWSLGFTRRLAETFLQLRGRAQKANCALFHQKHLQGPFSDEREAYFLCEVGHRIPCPILPASRPRSKWKVWTEESTISRSARV